MCFLELGNLGTWVGKAVWASVTVHTCSTRPSDIQVLVLILLLL